MKEVLLHIGIHKTGSSSIQESLKGYADQTTRSASFQEVNHSIPMTTIFSRNRYDYHIWRKLGLSRAEVEEKRADYLDILEKDISDNRYERLIISGEDMSTLYEEEKRDLISFFRTHGLNVRVFTFVRDPQDFAASSIQEHIKGGAKSLPKISTRYRVRLDEFRKGLPADCLIVRDFQKTISEFGDISTGFAKIVGLDIKSPVRANESLSSAATKLIYRLNKLPINTFGSRQRVSARGRVMALLANEFRQDDGGRLDRNMLSMALSPAENDEISYLNSEFGIAYPKVSATEDVQGVEGYLDDLSGLDVSRLHKIAHLIGAPVETSDSIDNLLISIYMRALISGGLRQEDADMLRDLAVRMEISADFDLSDAYKLMLLARRARPDGQLILKKVEQYEHRLAERRGRS